MIEFIGLHAAALESEYKLQLHGRSSIIEWFFRVMLYYHSNCILLHGHLVLHIHLLLHVSVKPYPPLRAVIRRYPCYSLRTIYLGASRFSQVKSQDPLL